MKTTFTFTVLLILVSFNYSLTQDCETYDKSLFQMLPDDFPTNINCRDNNGKKQGWWIDYRIKMDSIYNADGLQKKGTVKNYSYGMYKDDLMVGEWITIINQQEAIIKRRDNYYFAEDTIMIISGFINDGWNESSLYYNSDSSIIRATCKGEEDQFPLCFDCKRNRITNKECIITYRNKIIKEFSLDQFEFEFYNSYCEYKREKWLIDEAIRKNKNKEPVKQSID